MRNRRASAGFWGRGGGGGGEGSKGPKEQMQQQQQNQNEQQQLEVGLAVMEVSKSRVVDWGEEGEDLEYEGSLYREKGESSCDSGSEYTDGED